MRETHEPGSLRPPGLAWRRALKALLLPPNLFLWSGLGALVLLPIAPWWSTVVFGASFLALFLLATPAVAIALASTLDRHPPLPAAGELPPADAIVVLSAGLVDFAREHDGPDIGGIALERLRYGARLHRRTGLPVWITGYSAPLMARSLEEDFGRRECRVESRSRNTLQNAAFLTPILERKDMRKVYLVTHFWHLPRALRAFEIHGVEVIPAPMGFLDRGSLGTFGVLPGLGALELSGFVFHEWVGGAWYLVRYPR